MNTNPEIYIHKAAQQNASLRRKLETAKAGLTSIAQDAQRRADAIQDALNEKVTPFAILLKRKGEGWECLGIVNANNPPEDTPEDFDLVLPIPEPETLPEFSGW